jgi:tetrameric-type glycyl-tRNA synthetase alpha subunit
MSLQDAISRLSSFWAARGCLVLPPCTLEIPGGVLHPDAFFRLLDEEPWRAAYLQPVRRPLDGRYGRHPSRLARHLQFQVLLKAPGDDARDLYLASLADLGLELAVHDLRFAEWSWQALSLDAWGLGWHVLIDGLGVSRMTFLQQLAGRELEPVALEISYGLERLMMAVGRVRNAFELPWADGGPSYGELWRRDEEELTRYAAEVADAEAIERQLALFLESARRSLDAGLPRFAYEQTVKCLREIDLLETRRELSIRDREQRLGQVRDLVLDVAAAYLAARARPPAEPPGAVEAQAPAAAPEKKARTRKRKGSRRAAKKA